MAGIELDILYSRHALTKMVQRGITPVELRAVLESRDMIEDYPTDTPYPSALFFGIVGGRPLHVVATTRTEGSMVIVITLYEPSPDRWDATFRKRKP
jgi:hypothetical protein